MNTDSHTVTAYVSVGSNMGDSLGYALDAYNELASRPDIYTIRRSSMYRSKALGPGQQADYVNAVFRFTTGIEAKALLDILQKIEMQYGRERKIRWGPRTLDLDILLYGDTIMNTTDLTIPHPRLSERSFVIRPLLELDPELILPNGVALKNIPIDDEELNVITVDNNH